MFLIVCSFFSGILLVFAVQYLIARRWFSRLPTVLPTWKPQMEAFALPKELSEALKDDTCRKQKESCLSINVLLQFLFQELKDTKRIRRWVMKRMKMEFEEMLRSTTGKLLEHITVRDFNLGKTFPIIKNAAVDNVIVNDDNTLEEVTLVLDLTYSGRFQLAVDVEMVFGKSAYLSVVLTKLQGTARLQFTRQPYTHWSFAFMEDPQLQFEVESHFEGRPIARLASLIVNQIRKSVRRKHTLPGYKIRYRPFFVMPVPEAAPQTVYYQGNKLTVGRLEVVVVSCSRLAGIPPDSQLYCTLALDSIQWIELMSFRHKLFMAHDAEVIRTAGQNIGLSFGEIFLSDKYEEMVVVTAVVPGSPAAKANIQKNDLLVAINGVKLTNSRQAVRLMKNSAEKISLRVERAIRGFSGSVPKVVSTAQKAEDAVKGTQVTSLNTEASSEPASSVSQNGVLDTSEDDVSIYALAARADRSSLDEASSFKNLDVQSSHSSSVISAAISASSSPPLARKGLTQILTTGSGLFQRKKTRSEVSSGLTDLTMFSKDVAEKCSEIRPQAKPDIQTNNSQTTPKKEKKSAALDAKVTTSDDLTAQPTAQREANQHNRKSETHLVSGADSVITASRESNRQCSASVSSLSNDNSTGDRTKMRTTSFTKAGPNSAFNEKFEFEVEEKHNYLNICIWSKQPEKLDKQSRIVKPEKDVLLGHISIPLMDIALECLATLQGDVTNFYHLTPSETKVETGRSLYANLATHSGFNERLCHGELSLRFHYVIDNVSKKDRDIIVREDIDPALAHVNTSDSLKDSEDFASSCTSAPISAMNVQHNFMTAHFQTATYCNFCSKKIWLKTAFQCQLCQTVCHKKCMEKCQAQMKCTKPTERIPKEELEKADKEVCIDDDDGGLQKPEILQSEKAQEDEQGERKRHNSAPDEATSDTGITDRSELSPDADGLPRTRSSTSLVEMTIEPFVLPNARSLEDTENLSRMIHWVQNSPNSDELVVTQAKKIGKELFASLDLAARKAKLDSTILKLQGEIDSESEHKADLKKRDRLATDKKLKKTLQDKIEKSEGKLHSLTVLMLQYCAGLQHCLDQEELERQQHMEKEQGERLSVEQMEEQFKIEFSEEASEAIVAKEIEADATAEFEELGRIVTDAAYTDEPYQVNEERHYDQPVQRPEDEIMENSTTDIADKGDNCECLDDDVPEIVSESVELVEVDNTQSLIENVGMSSVSVYRLLNDTRNSAIEEEAENDGYCDGEIHASYVSDSVSFVDADLLEMNDEPVAGTLSRESSINEESPSSSFTEHERSVCH